MAEPSATGGAVRNSRNANVFNPKSWNPLCWILLLLWLAAGLLGNYPIFEPPTPEPFDTVEGMRVASYDQMYVIGMPSHYLEIRFPPNKPRTTTVHPWLLFWNVIAISATLVGIIYPVQTLIPKFSIRTIFLAITAVAVLIALGQLVFATGNYYLVQAFTLGIYFSPIAFSILAFAYAIFQKRKDSDQRR